MEKTQVQKKCRKGRKAGKVQQVVEGGGVQVETLRGQGRANRARSEKSSKKVSLYRMEQTLQAAP